MNQYQFIYKPLNKSHIFYIKVIKRIYYYYGVVRLILFDCSLMVTVNQSALVEGIDTVTVRNPLPFDCSKSYTDKLSVVGPPIVYSSTPAGFCEDVGGEMTIVGAKLSPMSRIILQNQNGVFNATSGMGPQYI